MAWVVVGVVLLVALLAGIFIGLRDIPPSDRARQEPIPSGTAGVFEGAWNRVNAWAEERKRLRRR